MANDMNTEDSLFADLNLILSLLNEYSGKLMVLNKELESLADKSLFGMVTLFRNVSLLILAPYLAWYFISMNSAQPVSPEYLLFLYPFVFVIMAPVIYSYLINVRKLKRQIINDARTIATKLERIIRVASQAEDHLKMNYGSRLEFDLRLADAESAIAHFYQFLRANHFSKSASQQ